MDGLNLSLLAIILLFCCGLNLNSACKFFTILKIFNILNYLFFNIFKTLTIAKEITVTEPVYCMKTVHRRILLEIMQIVNVLDL